MSISVFADMRKDNPHHIDVWIQGKDEAETIVVQRGKGSRGKWQKLENTLESLDWTQIQTRTEDNALIGSYDAPDFESTTLANPAENFTNPTDPDVAKYEVIVAGQVAILDRFIDYEKVKTAQSDAFLGMIMSRLESLEGARLEDNEILRQKALESVKLDQGSQQMSGALAGFIDVLKAVAPDLVKDILSGALGSGPGQSGAELTGGNGQSAAKVSPAGPGPTVIETGPVIDTKEG